MSNPRRDVFVFVAKPGQREEAITYVAEWLESLKGIEGFLGGTILRETANEVFNEAAFVLLMDFESTEKARIMWPKIENTINPLYSDDKSENKTFPDQAPRIFDGTDQADLYFNRGNGTLALMLHLHAEVATEVKF